MADPTRSGRGLVEWLATIYYEGLPRGLLRLLNPAIEPAYAVTHRLAAIAADSFPRLELLQDSQAGDRDPGLVVAGRGDARSIFLEPGWAGKPRVTRLGRCPLWLACRPQNRTGRPVPLIEADRCYRHLLARRGYVAVPDWVLFTLDLSEPWPTFVSRLRQRLPDNLRRIRSQGYSYRIEHNQVSLRNFYDRMYVPYITARFGESALFASRGYMESVFDRGGLLLATQAGEDVAGFVFSTATSDPLVAFVGVKDAEFAHVRKGAVSALYFFTMLWAKEHNYKTIDFGHTHPFLDDGLFSYKARWGMQVRPSDRRTRALFVHTDRDSRVTAFLQRPMLVYDQGGNLAPLEATGPSRLGHGTKTYRHSVRRRSQRFRHERRWRGDSPRLESKAARTAVLPKHYKWRRGAYELLDIGPKAAIRRGVAALRSRRAGNGNALEFPITVSIEVTDHCNLACPSCPQPLLPDPKGYMDLETACRVIDDCARHSSLTSMVFTGYGEPLLHPQLCEMSLHAKDRGIPVVRTYTNCKSLTPARTEAILTRSSFDEITLSLNAPSADLYRSIKGDDGYTRVKQNVRHFFRRKRELGIRKPFANLVLLVLNDVSYDFDAFAAEWKPLLGAGDCIRWKASHNFAGQVDGTRFGGVFPAGERMPCGQLWNYLFVSRAGSVSPCCVDPFKRLAIGNVHESTLKEIWESDRLRCMRTHHIAGEYDRLPLCDRCETWRYFTPEAPRL